MWMAVFFFVLAILVIAGVVVANLATKEEQQQNARVSTMRAYHIRLQEMQETLQVLSRYCGRQAILIAIIDEMHYVLNLLSDVGDDSAQANIDYWQQQLQQAREAIDENHDTLDTLPRHSPENEREIALFRRHAGRAIRMISKLAEQGGITKTQADEYKAFLRTMTLRCEVLGYLRQGDQHEAMGERLKAAAYYKHGKELLVASELEFDGKSDEIRRIAKMVSGVYESHQEAEMKKEADKFIVDALLEEEKQASKPAQ